MKFSLCERIDKYDVCIIRTTPPLRKFADNNFENWHCEICVMLAIDHIRNYCCIKTLNFAFCKQIIKLVHSEHLDVETSHSSSLSVCLCLASCAHGQRYITGCPEQTVEGQRSELSMMVDMLASSELSLSSESWSQAPKVMTITP